MRSSARHGPACAPSPEATGAIRGTRSPRPPRVGPPRVRLRDEAPARVQAMVIHGVGYPLTLYQRAQISFGGRPDAVADFRQDLAEARRTLNRPPGELVRALRDA